MTKKIKIVDEVKSNTTPSWGRMLTKKELLDMLDRIYAKQNDRKEK
jgi:hypothetical protein